MNRRTTRVISNAREICIFSMLGAIMYISKIVMEALPNIHLLGVLTVSYTVVYRKRALIPIYIYVMLNGVFSGFNMWWLPYTYIWTILWGIVMLLPQNMNRKIAIPIYSVVCGIHGFAFGTLYAPAQALMFGFNFKQMIAWIVAGLPFDMIHGFSNMAFGFLALPLSELLKKLSKNRI
jgi:energy-coupling factor transport system substrate-specific component